MILRKKDIDLLSAPCANPNMTLGVLCDDFHCQKCGSTLSSGTVPYRGILENGRVVAVQCPYCAFEIPAGGGPIPVEVIEVGGLIFVQGFSRMD